MQVTSPLPRNRFYLGKHNGRQLTLQANLGSAEVTAIFFGLPSTRGSGIAVASTEASGVGQTSLAVEQATGSASSHESSSAIIVQPESAPISSHTPAIVSSATGGSGVVLRSGSLAGVQSRKYILQVSTFQMIVLMLFNDQAEWTLRDMLAMSNIADKDLVRTLQSLMMGKQAAQRLLIKAPPRKEIGKFWYFCRSFSLVLFTLFLKLKVICISVRGCRLNMTR